ncbi:type II toxin-antitoxin system prevent-host-death family antitoxin [Xanthomonas vasicola]|uniref:type II toxin-antitoxin system prevent-host-death family antitoxin n=1 Tax=Xanthomonas vasicola TaxID=56459 RepID=UPI000ADC2E17
MNIITYSAARLSRRDHGPRCQRPRAGDHHAQRRTSCRHDALDDYKAMEETAYLLRSPKSAQRLLESIAQLEAGRGKERGLTE